MSAEFPPYDLYEELGLSPRATPRLIEAAYRALAKECHPDTATDPAAAEARMKRVNASHDVLADSRRTRSIRRMASRRSLMLTARAITLARPTLDQRRRGQPNECPTCHKVYRTVAGLQWHRANVEPCQ